MSSSGGVGAGQPPGLGVMETLQAGGELTYSRFNATGGFGLASGVVTLGPAQLANVTELISNVSTVSQGTAAVGATFAGYAVYSVDASGNCTRVAQTANTLTLWTATFSDLDAPQNKAALQAAFTKQAGIRYAVAKLYVGPTPPSLIGSSPSTAFASVNLKLPFRGAVTAGGQAAFPANIAIGSLSGSGTAFFDALLP